MRGPVFKARWALKALALLLSLSDKARNWCEWAAGSAMEIQAYRPQLSRIGARPTIDTGLRPLKKCERQTGNSAAAAFPLSQSLASGGRAKAARSAAVAWRAEDLKASSRQHCQRRGKA